MVFVMTPVGAQLSLPQFSLAQMISEEIIPADTSTIGGINFLVVDTTSRRALTLYHPMVVEIGNRETVTVVARPDGQTQVYVTDEASVKVIGDAHVMVTGRGRLTGYGTVDGVFREESRGALFNASKALVSGQAEVHIADACAATVIETGLLTMQDGCQAWASDMGRIIVEGSLGTAHARGSARIELAEGARPMSLMLGDSSSLAVPPTMSLEDLRPALNLAPNVTIDSETGLTAQDFLSVSSTPTRGYQEGGSPEEDQALYEAEQQQGAAAEVPADDGDVDDAAQSAPPVIGEGGPVPPMPPPPPAAAPVAPAAEPTPVRPLTESPLPPAAEFPPLGSMTGAPIVPSAADAPAPPAPPASESDAQQVQEQDGSGQGEFVSAAGADAAETFIDENGQEVALVPPPVSPYRPDFSDGSIYGPEWVPITGGVPDPPAQDHA